MKARLKTRNLRRTRRAIRFEYQMQAAHARLHMNYKRMSAREHASILSYLSVRLGWGRRGEA